ncbi:hypothetical protein D3C83_277110 [compost metagenome]
MVKGGRKAKTDAGEPGDIPNPAMWAWNMMADAAKSMPQAPAAGRRGKRAKKRGKVE